MPFVIWSEQAIDVRGCIGVQKGTAAPGTPLVLTYAPDFPSAPTLQWLNDNASWQWAFTPGPAPYENYCYIESTLPTFIKMGPFKVPRPPFVIDIEGKAADGTALVINPMAGWTMPWPLCWPWYPKTVSVSQLWIPLSVAQLGAFQSVQDPSLVISVDGATTAQYTPLVLWQIMETAGTPTYPNQTWAVEMVLAL
jgi:hypothetical protein